MTPIKGEENATTGQTSEGLENHVDESQKEKQSLSFGYKIPPPMVGFKKGYLLLTRERTESFPPKISSHHRSGIHRIKLK